MAIYRDDGYFASEDYDVLAARVMGATVTEPMRVVRGFVREFG
jgi:GMP synthase (glutamine-hydrolysing)